MPYIISIRISNEANDDEVMVSRTVENDDAAMAVMSYAMDAIGLSEPLHDEEDELGAESHPGNLLLRLSPGLTD
jgi:hypothetical protein